MIIKQNSYCSIRFFRTRTAKLSNSVRGYFFRVAAIGSKLANAFSVGRRLGSRNETMQAIFPAGEQHIRHIMHNVNALQEAEAGANAKVNYGLTSI